MGPTRIALTPLQWDSGLETGDITVDLHRMQLFAVVNDLSAALELDASRWEVADAVFDLLRYIGANQAQEEELMQLSGYPDLSDHVRSHRVFAREMERAMRGYFSNRSANPEQLLACASGWLREHVDTSDRSFAMYIQSARSRTPAGTATP